jgi:type II secretory pathway pseudopilin PulG
MSPKHQKMSGFTLVEMGMVMVILALILGGLLMPLSMQMELRSRQDTKETMDNIKEALIGFALTNGRLPCPDFDGDGIEDTGTPPTVDAWNVSDTTPTVDEVRRPTTACADATPANLYQGFLPFVSIGIGRQDNWVTRFTYSVSPEFTDIFNVWADSNANGSLDVAESTVPALRSDTSLSSKGNIAISDRSAPGVLNDLIGSAAAPSTWSAAAVIISHGKNRFGGTDAFSGAAMPAAAANSDEFTNTSTALNANNVSQKIARSPSPLNGGCDDASAGSTFCEYDDMVDWIAPTILLNRMVAAGKLP